MSCEFVGLTATLGVFALGVPVNARDEVLCETSPFRSDVWFRGAGPNRTVGDGRFDVEVDSISRLSSHSMSDFRSLDLYGDSILGRP
jgi:hypothetical protein